MDLSGKAVAAGRLRFVCSRAEYGIQMQEKTLLESKDCDLTGSLAVEYGYEYVFLLDTKKDSVGWIYQASCINTSSSSAVTFRNGALKY